MRSTKEQRDRRRAEHWATRPRAAIGPLPAEAMDLLVARLAARRRADWQASPLVVLAVGGFAWGVIQDVDRTRGVWRVAAFWLAPTMLLMCHGILTREVTARGDRRIAAGLRQRVTRGAYVPVRMMLGRSRTRSAVSIAWLAVIGGAVGFEVLSGWRWAFLAWLLAMCALTVAQLWRVTTRPAIAPDLESLAVDERLRSNDVARPPWVGAVAGPGGSAASTAMAGGRLDGTAR